MPKVTTAKNTKAASKPIVQKKPKAKDADDKPKEKREPTAYDIFRKAENERLKADEPGLDATARREKISDTWLNHADNPNRGKPRKPRAPKKAKPAVEPATDSSSLPPSSPVSSSP